MPYNPVSRLEIVNFKSFQGRNVVCTFRDVTAVIGPNELGKYHLLDALNFVLACEPVSIDGSACHVAVVIQLDMSRCLRAERRVKPDARQHEFKINGKLMTFAAYVAKLRMYRINMNGVGVIYNGKALLQLIRFTGDDHYRKVFERHCGSDQSIEKCESFESELKMIEYERVNLQCRMSFAKRKLLLCRNIVDDHRAHIQNIKELEELDVYRRHQHFQDDLQPALEKAQQTKRKLKVLIHVEQAQAVEYTTEQLDTMLRTNEKTMAKVTTARAYAEQAKVHEKIERKHSDTFESLEHSYENSNIFEKLLIEQKLKLAEDEYHDLAAQLELKKSSSSIHDIDNDDAVFDEVLSDDDAVDVSDDDDVVILSDDDDVVVVSDDNDLLAQLAENGSFDDTQLNNFRTFSEHLDCETKLSTDALRSEINDCLGGGSTADHWFGDIWRRTITNQLAYGDVVNAVQPSLNDAVIVESADDVFNSKTKCITFVPAKEILAMRQRVGGPQPVNTDDQRTLFKAGSEAVTHFPVISNFIEQTMLFSGSESEDKRHDQFDVVCTDGTILKSNGLVQFFDKKKQMDDTMPTIPTPPHSVIEERRTVSIAKSEPMSADRQQTMTKLLETKRNTMAEEADKLKRITTAENKHYAALLKAFNVTNLNELETLLAVDEDVEAQLETDSELTACIQSVAKLLESVSADHNSLKNRLKLMTVKNRLEVEFERKNYLNESCKCDEEIKRLQHEIAEHERSFYETLLQIQQSGRSVAGFKIDGDSANGILIDNDEIELAFRNNEQIISQTNTSEMLQDLRNTLAAYERAAEQAKSKIPILHEEIVYLNEQVEGNRQKWDLVVMSYMKVTQLRKKKYMLFCKHIADNLKHTYAVLYDNHELTDVHVTYTEVADCELRNIDLHFVPPVRPIPIPLSSNQQTMAAVALLFTVISKTLLPFVVLDIRDSGLDDLNTKLLMEFINDLATNIRTQVIVVSNNPIVRHMASSVIGIAQTSSNAKNSEAFFLDVLTQ